MKQNRKKIKDLIKQCRPEITEEALDDIVYAISDYIDDVSDNAQKQNEDLLQAVKELKEFLEGIEIPTTKDEIRLQEIKNLEYKLSEIVLNNRK